jgi:hypothetical protein
MPMKSTQKFLKSGAHLYTREIQRKSFPHALKQRALVAPVRRKNTLVRNALAQPTTTLLPEASAQHPPGFLLKVSAQSGLAR